MNAFIAYSLFILLNLRLAFNVGHVGYVISHSAVFALLWFSIFANAYKLRRVSSNNVRINRELLFLFIVLLGMISVGYLRANISGLIPFTGFLSAIFRLWTLVLGIFLILYVSMLKGDMKIVNGALFISLNFYIFLVVMLHLIGIENANRSIFDDSGPARLLSLVGISIERVRFPMASGVNVFGVLSSFAIVANVSLLILKVYSRGSRLLVIAGLALSSYVIICADSRAAIAYTLLSVSIILYVRDRKVMKLSFVPVLIPFSAVLIFASANVLPDEILLALSRGGSGSLIPGRDVLWEGIGSHFLHDFSFLHFLGYGLWGQVTSGIINPFFATVFSDASIENRLLSSNVHNFALQTLIDFGYIGLLFSIFFFVKVLKSLFTCFLRYRSPAFLFHGFVFLHLVWVGMSEAVPTIAIPDLFLIFLYICVWAILMPGDNPSRRFARSRVSDGHSGAQGLGTL